MELKGKIIKVMDPVTGGSGAKPWAKQEFILEIPSGQYTKNVAMSLWGQDKIDMYDLSVGITVTAHINLESREYNGRWYTDVRAWKLEWSEQQARKWQPGNQPTVSESKSEHCTAPDDLPF